MLMFGCLRVETWFNDGIKEVGPMGGSWHIEGMSSEDVYQGNLNILVQVQPSFSTSFLDHDAITATPASITCLYQTLAQVGLCNLVNSNKPIFFLKKINSGF